MSARSRSLWTLLVCTAGAAALGLYAWFGVMKGDAQQAEAKRDAEKLVQPTLQPDGGTATVRYDRLSVKAKGELTELERTADQPWVLTRPLRAAADARAVEELVNALQYARLRRWRRSPPPKTKVNGLDKPPVEVTAASAEGRRLTVKVA
jgi:hypothetical protein